MPEPILCGTYKPLRDKTPRTNRQAEKCIKRRARDLAMVAELVYVDAMKNELRQGLLPMAGIEFWEPAPGTKITKLLDRVRHELDACRGLAGILFP
jgi:hypothetical protein